MIRKAHYFSGIVIFLFAIVHILNHLMVLKSEAAHILFMDAARLVYRHPVAETILFIAIGIQAISGVQLVRKKWKIMNNVYDRLQVFSGLYLVYFIPSHTLAVLIGRHIMDLDTNLYFAASVVNNMPAVFYYVFHYGLAIVALFTHLGCVHRQKAVRFFSHEQLNFHCWLMVAVGMTLAILVLSHMIGITIPKSFQYVPFGKY